MKASWHIARSVSLRQVLPPAAVPWSRARRSVNCSSSCRLRWVPPRNVGRGSARPARERVLPTWGSPVTTGSATSRTIPVPGWPKLWDAERLLLPEVPVLSATQSCSCPGTLGLWAPCPNLWGSIKALTSLKPNLIQQTSQSLVRCRSLQPQTSTYSRSTWPTASTGQVLLLNGIFLTAFHHSTVKFYEETRSAAARYLLT